MNIWMNILRVKRKSTIRVFFVAILAPVSAQLIRTSDWDQNSGVRLVFGLIEKTERKTNPKSEVVHCTRENPAVVFCVTDTVSAAHAKLTASTYWRQDSGPNNFMNIYRVSFITSMHMPPEQMYNSTTTNRKVSCRSGCCWMTFASASYSEENMFKTISDIILRLI